MPRSKSPKATVKKCHGPQLASFDCSEQDKPLILKIAQRAVELGKKHGVPYELRDASMDVTACHVNGCALRLQDLLAATDTDFGHDVFGIRRYLERITGQIDPVQFTPRFAGKQ